MAKLNWLKAALASLLLSMAMVATAAPLGAATGDNIRYRIQKDENLFSLANAYFLKLSDYKQVQRLNKIASPRRIPIGTVIEIPRSLLKYRAGTARLLSVRGNVTNGRTGAALGNGQTVAEGAMLVTGANSFATVVLDDGSRVSLPSNSSVAISRLRTYILGGSVDYDFDVGKGGARSRVVKKKSEDDRYRVRTKRAVTAVRGTEFQSRYDEESGTDFAEVSEGVVDIAADGAQLPVEAGKGLVITANGQPKVEALAAAPKVVDASKIQANPLVEFAVEGARPDGRYHLAIATDAGFVDQLADVDAPGGKGSFAALPNGNYFLRARETASSGLQGQYATYGFKRRLNGIKASVETLGDAYMFKWAGEGEGVRRFHFQLIRAGSEVLPMVDEAGLSVQQIAISDLPPGEYSWRVGSVQYLDGEVTTNWTTPEKLTIATQ